MKFSFFQYNTRYVFLFNTQFKTVYQINFTTFTTLNFTNFVFALEHHVSTWVLKVKPTYY